MSLQNLYNNLPSSQQQDFLDMLGVINASSGNPSNWIPGGNWYNNWINNPSLYNYSQIINILITNSQPIDIQYACQVVINRFFQTFIYDLYLINEVPTFVLRSPNIYPSLTIPGRNNYTPLQEFILQWATKISGFANSAIESVCSSYNRSQIAASKPLVEWCGCFSPNTTIVPVPKECDPMCTQAEILLYNNNRVVECNGTVCVMDNITINATGSLGKSINIYQICPGCQTNPGQCRCIIDSSLLNLGIKQYCPNAECIIIDSKTGATDIAKCNTEQNSQTSSVLSPNFIIVLGLCTIFSLMLLVAIRKNSRRIIKMAN